MVQSVDQTGREDVDHAPNRNIHPSLTPCKLGLKGGTISGSDREGGCTRLIPQAGILFFFHPSQITSKLGLKLERTVCEKAVDEGGEVDSN